MITDNKVVTMHFTLKNQSDEVLETTIGEEPFVYLQGAMEILPPLETALEGKDVGDKLTVTIAAEDAYGKHNKELVEVVPISEFEEMGEPVKEGMEIEMQIDDDIFPVIVTKIEDGEVTLDMNHPLADMDLTFDVEIIALRDATTEEIEHGHVHHGSNDH